MSEWPKTLEESRVYVAHEVIPYDLGRELHEAIEALVADPYSPDAHHLGQLAIARYEREVGDVR